MSTFLFPDVPMARLAMSATIVATPEQIAWMAALFEGEGSIVAPKSRKERQCGHSSPLRIKFSMCDVDVLEQFKQFACGGHLRGPHAPSGLGKKPFYSLVIQGGHAFALAKLIWPWLGLRRKEQVRIAIERWASLRESKEGKVITASQAREIRRQLKARGHGSGRALATEYGVSAALISKIKRGHIWASVST